MPDDSSKTGFLLSYEIQGSLDEKRNDNPGKVNCTINLLHVETRTAFQIGLPQNKKMLQLEAPEGSYRIESLSCGGNSTWELGNFGAGAVHAYFGKFNFLGRFIFKLSHVNAVYELSMSRGNREDTRTALIAYTHERPPSYRARLVSAYNGKAWDVKYLEDEKNYSRGTTSKVVGPRVSLKQMDFSQCEKNEIKTNPAPLGRLSYKVNYDGNRMIQLQKTEEHHSFSSEYVQCVENSMQKFEPGYEGKVEFDVNL